MPDASSIDIDEVASYLADFYQNSRIDWDDALYRVECAFDVDLPENVLDPLIKRIKSAYRAEIRARKE